MIDINIIILFLVSITIGYLMFLNNLDKKNTEIITIDNNKIINNKQIIQDNKINKINKIDVDKYIKREDTKYTRETLTSEIGGSKSFNNILLDDSNLNSSIVNYEHKYSSYRIKPFILFK